MDATCHGIKSICPSHVPAVSAEISSAVSTAVYGVLGFLLLVRFYFNSYYFVCPSFILKLMYPRIFEGYVA